jgi:hypothetical protein
LRNVPIGDKVVFFVRDPLKRFVSAFNSRKRLDQPRYYCPWSFGEEAAFRRFHTPNELAQTLSSTDQTAQKAAVRAMKSIYHIRSSYWDWFGSEAYVRSRLPDILLIGFQETLNEDFGVLRKRLGLPESVVLPEDEIAAHRSPRHLDTSLGEEAKKNLKEWYAADYEFIRLCRELIKQLGRWKA